MDIALDGCHEHYAVPLGLVGIFTRRKGRKALLLLHEWSKVGHSLLHHTGTLDDLRQEHLSCAEEIADDAHALHERTFDDVERNFEVGSCLLDVTVNELVDAIDEPVVETLNVGAVSPGILCCSSACCATSCRWRRFAHILSELEESLDVLAISRLVQDHLFGQLSSICVDVGVPGKASRVDDGHVETRGHGVIEEDAVHGVTQGVQATEREREVAEATAKRDAWAGSLDLGNCVDEVNAVSVVLWQTCRNGEHVAVKDDVLWREVKLLAQERVTALADSHLVLESGGLALLIESHDDNSCTVAHAKSGVAQEFLLSRLQRYGVHDALALHALQALLHNRPLG
mmetsp:Transcript_45881/g.82585  ORF Transcript_45881/g.82585 Transcript_45881/m.82585 type:complete len:343 (-) Transcript_45881:1114-2142(-)